MYGGLCDAEAQGHLARGEHTAIAQPVATTGQFVGAADEGDLLQVEGLRFPGLQPTLVEDFCDLAVTMLIEEAVNLGNECRVELADLRNGQGSIERGMSRSLLKLA